MLKIRLFCAGGLSTSMLVKKMEAAAKEQGIEVDIAACAESSMEQNLDGVDVALLGPQIRYRLSAAEVVCGKRNIPVALIEPVDYGCMNGKKVLEMAIKLAKK